jgi:hypothetical protein
VIAVAVPLAAVAVIGVVAAMVAVGWVRKRRLRAGRNSINFSPADGLASAADDEL